MKRIGDWILRRLLKNTWHICNHSFEVKKVDIKGRYTEQQCKFCHVNATTQFNETLLILVDPETNHPYKLDPWGLAGKSTPGINLKQK